MYLIKLYHLRSYTKQKDFLGDQCIFVKNICLLNYNKTLQTLNTSLSIIEMRLNYI
jgi:hypothetical protein